MVIAPACQAGDHGFDPRCSRILYYIYCNRALITKGSMAKMVIAPACQAGDHGFDPRCSRINVICNGYVFFCTFSFIKYHFIRSEKPLSIISSPAKDFNLNVITL